MFTILFIFASGFKLFLPLADTIENDSQQGCQHAAVEIAKTINDNHLLVDDKVVIIQCLRNG